MVAHHALFILSSTLIPLLQTLNPDMALPPSLSPQNVPEGHDFRLNCEIPHRGLVAAKVSTTLYGPFARNPSLSIFF
jgi:hypothetical protein